MKALLAFALVVLAVPAMAQLPTWAENVCAEEDTLACHAMHRAYNPARFYLWPNNANEARRFVDLRPQWMVDEDWQVCQRQSQWNIPGDRDNASDVLEALMHGPNRYDEHNRLMLSIFRGGESASGHFAFYIEGQNDPAHSNSVRAWSIHVGTLGRNFGNPFLRYRPAWFARGDMRLNVRRLLNWLRHEEVRLSLFNTRPDRRPVYAPALAEFAEGHGLPAVPEMRNAGTNRLTLWWYGPRFRRDRWIFHAGWWGVGANPGDWLTMTCDNAE